MTQHPDPVTTPGTHDLEHRIGIVPLEELLAKRHALVQQVAGLRARYGPGGTYEALRKVQLARVAQVIRAEAVRDGRKITEAAVNDLSHADDRYASFVTQVTEERAAWSLLEDEIQGVTETINRGQALARFAAAEVSL